MFHWTQVAYYLLIGLDCIILLFWVIKRSKKMQLSVGNALDLTALLMLSAFIGARFFHVLYEEPNFYKENPQRVLQIWYGGFVFYGGFLGAVVSGILWLKYKKLDLLTWMDFFAPMGAFAYAFGRLSCVMAGCCYGKEAKDLPWAIVNHTLNDSIPRHPTQWYSIFWELMVLIILLLLEKKQFLKKGFLFFIWIFLHALGRIIMEAFRADPRGAFLLNLSIATWISILLILVSISFFALRSCRKTNSSSI
jgi:phosphatidylglycerol:prolipoprotein diacylglycerol transferase